MFMITAPPRPNLRFSIKEAFQISQRLEPPARVEVNFFEERIVPALQIFRGLFIEANHYFSARQLPGGKTSWFSSATTEEHIVPQDPPLLLEDGGFKPRFNLAFKGHFYETGAGTFREIFDIKHGILIIVKSLSTLDQYSSAFCLLCIANCLCRSCIFPP